MNWQKSHNLQALHLARHTRSNCGPTGLRSLCIAAGRRRIRRFAEYESLGGFLSSRVEQRLHRASHGRHSTRQACRMPHCSVNRGRVRIATGYAKNSLALIDFQPERGIWRAKLERYLIDRHFMRNATIGQAVAWKQHERYLALRQTRKDRSRYAIHSQSIAGGWVAGIVLSP